VRRRKVERRQGLRKQGSRQVTERKVVRRILPGVMGGVILAVFFFMAGCGGEAPKPLPTVKPKAPMVAKKKTETPKPAVPTPAGKEEPAKQPGTAEYTYNPAGKADPFKPFIQLTPARAARTAPLTPLQRYEMSQLKLVAIIAAPEGNIALVEDSAGKGFFLKRGTLVGKNDGKVAKILKDRVIVEEVYQDINGQGKSSEVILYLHRPEEEEGTQP
jgi:type IV pilus assembly protein PilP